MFRRLAESFESGMTNSNQSSNPHANYIQEQNKYFNTLPNIIPSATSGLKGFDVAIQSVNANGTNYLQPAVKYPNDIFIKDTSPKLAKQIEQCASADIDQLIASKNPSAEVGCGWLYTPPINGSPYPQLSQGFLGNDSGPIASFDPPAYKKWFFDLQNAKKQILMDKCKSLKSCADVDSEVYSGVCGFCMDINQGIPIDGAGRALYSGDPRAACSPESIVRTGSQCPITPSASEDGSDSGYDNGQGPQPMIDRTCVPVNGKLSSMCLHRQVLSAGCNTNGSLAIALQGSSDPTDYIANLRNSDAVKIYNRVANPPMNLDIFTQGQTTTTAALQEVRRIAGNATQSATSAIGAAARDLCLQRGAINNYDACNDLSDTAPSPFYIVCLQKIFQKMGGQPAGSMFPSETTINTYNSMGTLGAVKQYLNQIIANMQSKDYNTQRTAMIQFLGISPEKLITRAPYKQGVEVFWFVAVPGNPSKVAGFLKRTIERDIVQLGNGPSRISQLGGIPYGCMVQLTDIRAPNDFAVKFRVTVDDGFWIGANQPANIDTSIMSQRYADTPGLFANLGLQGATTYQSAQCTTFSASKPNITKMYFEDAGGGWQCFNFSVIGCSGTPAFQPIYYSLTCETNAPFLTYEVGATSNQFEELRNPGLFGQFLGITMPEYHVRTDERNSVPGKKSYTRINSMNASINLKNIAYQSWKTATFAVRLQSMPVKETMISFACSGALYYNLIATPINGSIATITVYHNFGGGAKVVPTTIQLSINKWYMFVVNNRDTGFDLACYNIADMAAGSGVSNTVSINHNGPLFLPNATWNPAPGQNYQTCNVIVGTKGFVGTWSAFYGTSSFTYDLAWVHFFDRFSSKDDLVRECKCDWIYTPFPESYNKYNMA